VQGDFVVAGAVHHVQRDVVYVDLGSGVFGLLFIDQISKARLAPEDLDNIFAEGDKIMASRFRRVGCMGKVAKRKVCMPHAGCSVYIPV
jgi:exosome complex RNA-binding protein Rrp4